MDDTSQVRRILHKLLKQVPQSEDRVFTNENELVAIIAKCLAAFYIDLPQSLPRKVQAQQQCVSLLIKALRNITFISCTHSMHQINYWRLLCLLLELKGDRAGPYSKLQILSVINSSSCPTLSRPCTNHAYQVIINDIKNVTLKTIHPITATIILNNNHSCIILLLPTATQIQNEIPKKNGGNDTNFKLIQSVNVSLIIAAINQLVNKGTGVTVPINVYTPNNSFSVKLLVIVNVINNIGALSTTITIFNNNNVIPLCDIPFVIIQPIVQGIMVSSPMVVNKLYAFDYDKKPNHAIMNRYESNSGLRINDCVSNNNDLKKNVIDNNVNVMNNNSNNNFNTNDLMNLNELIRQQKIWFKHEKQLGRSLRLHGGGESSLGTTGWGSPSANSNNNGNAPVWGGNSNNNNPNAQNNWNNTARNNPASTSTNNSENNANKSNQNVQNQAPTTNNGGNQNQNWGQNNNNSSGKVGGNQPNVSANNNQMSSGQPLSVTSNSAKQQLEQLNSMREAIYSHEGWGGQHVNQDTHWDIPSSPEPPQKTDGNTNAPVWKPPVNNGTELWEANLRNGGQPPPPVQKAPWGHTPATNIGGTWGEDDDVTDSSNVWTGVPSNQQPQAPGLAPGQWGPGNGAGAGPVGSAATGGPNTPMWPGAGVPKKEEWGPAGAGPIGGGAIGQGTNVPPPGWGQDPRAGGPPIDPREAALRAASIDPRTAADAARDPRLLLSDMRGDPRGISGRLNGEAMWGVPPQPPPHNIAGHHQPPGKITAPNGLNQWGSGPSKDMNLPQGKPSGWEEPSPPSQRRNLPPNYDDGTSLWGNPNQPPHRLPGTNKHWGDIPPTGGPIPNRNNAPGVATPGSGICPPGVVGGNARKPEASLFGRTGNGSWGDDVMPPHWNSGTNVSGADDLWNKQKAPGQWGGENELDWHKQQGLAAQKLSKEAVWSSKQFRFLVEMGFKKEDVENALRMRGMVAEDALDYLRSNTVDGWRNVAGVLDGPGRHDEHVGFDHMGAGGQYGQRFGPPGGPGQMQYPPNSNTPMGNINANNNNNNGALGSMSPAVIQKMLAASVGGGNGGNAGLNGGNQAQFGNVSAAAVNAIAAMGQNRGAAGNNGIQTPLQQPQQAVNNGSGGQSSNGQTPSQQQLRTLVYQIQMAVQAGFLNHQILNQPLAPQTLILLNQLLQHIKALHTLTQQNTMIQSQPNSVKNSNAFLQTSVQITKTRQLITNLQNQITANQALYMKQNQGGNGGSVGGNGNGPPNDFFKNDPIISLQTNFADLGLNKDAQNSTFLSQQQSRLNQWIKSDKDDITGVEFSRAPGTLTNKSTTSHSSPMNLGLGQSDGPWSNGRSGDGSGWPETPSDVHDGSKDAWSAAQAAPTAYTDLVPEFEPGKPWKGNQMKTIEDDPSITPGSVVRSPLSMPLIKDDNLFGGPPTTTSKLSPTGGDLNTWSYSSSTGFNSPLNKMSKNTWSDVAPQPTAVTSELWGAPMGGKTRGPPPGLAAKGQTYNSWANNLTAGITGNRGGNGGGGTWGSNNWSNGSCWLLLKNLTAQIDGSTLQTLCKQHGPLSNFHLYLNHGYALAKYHTREEATKAQTALNNCVLGNTTILADTPSESEVNQFMQTMGQTTSGAVTTPVGLSGATLAPAGGWRNNTKPIDSTWSGNGGGGGWPPNASAAGGLWGAATSTLDNDTQRATPSNLNSFLPGDLLGGESM